MIRLIFVLALLLLAVPAGVQAAGSLITIVDSSTSTKARVDSATSALRVGGITKKLLDTSEARPSPGSVSYTVATSPYSQLRIMVEHQPNASTSGTVTVECVEAGIRSCVLAESQPWGPSGGYNAVYAVPGATVRVTITIGAQFGAAWHVVVYGHAP